MARPLPKRLWLASDLTQRSAADIQKFPRQIAQVAYAFRLRYPPKIILHAAFAAHRPQRQAFLTMAGTIEVNRPNPVVAQSN